MENIRENNKKWIKTLQERNRVLEEILQLTQIENEELKEQLRIGAVEGRSEELKAFVEWQKKYKDSSYVDCFNVDTYLKSL